MNINENLIKIGKTLGKLLLNGVIRPKLDTHAILLLVKFAQWDHLNAKNIVLKNKCILVTLNSMVSMATHRAI